MAAITFIAALHVTARKPKCLSTDEWLNRHGLPVPSKILADKKKWSINTCKTWVIPEDGMLSEKKPFTKGLLLLLLLSRFSRVRLCATLETAAHQASPSLGFSRQEQWSGLPFPSPMHESEKWKGSCPVVSNFLATPWTTAYQAPPSMGFSRQEYWSGVPLPSLSQ